MEKKVQEVLSKTNEEAVKIDSTTTTSMQSNQMDYSTKTREELIALCKEKKIKGYSGKKKEEIIQLLTNITPIATTTETHNTINNATHIIENNIQKYKVISLFSGMGGMDV